MLGTNKVVVVVVVVVVSLLCDKEFYGKSYMSRNAKRRNYFLFLCSKFLFELILFSLTQPVFNLRSQFVYLGFVACHRDEGLLQAKSGVKKTKT